MLQKRNDLEIVLLLLDTKMHLRQIAKSLKLVPSTAMRVLNKLEKDSILDFTMEGKNKTYSLKETPEARHFKYIAEHYRLLKTLQKPLIRNIYKEIIQMTSGELILIFGSYASSSETAKSDIDLYVETTDRKLSEDIRKLSEKIQLQAGKLDKDSSIAKEIIKNHVILQNVERFYQAIKG